MGLLPVRDVSKNPRFEARCPLAPPGFRRKERLMDITTIVGLIASILLLVGMAGSGLGGLYEGMTLLFVAVGGFAATMISLPLYRIVSLPGVIKNAFFWTGAVPIKLIERMVDLGETARREGILALEKRVGQNDDPFLSAGVRLAVDGTEPDLIMDILETELQFKEQRHKHAHEALRILARNWAIFGILGALIVLVLQVDTTASGTVLLRQAALPLLYGGILATLIGLPFARKLEEYSAREVLTKRMIIEGIMAIQSGDNPRIIEHKLSVFLSPRDRPTGDKKESPPPEEAAEKEESEEAQPSPPEEQPAEPTPSQAEEEEEPSPPEKEPEKSKPTAPPPRTGEAEAKLEIEQVDLLLRLVRETLERHAVDAERMALIDLMIGRVVEEKLVLFTLFSLLGEEIREEVLVVLEKEAPQLVSQVRSQGGWFDFDDLVQLTDREIQTLLREVDQKDMTIALKGAGDEVRGKMLGNMSARVRNFINQEMQEMGEVAENDIRETQGRIIQQTIQLQLQGQIGGLGSERMV